ncbi:MAG: DUF2231 domain-containing protein [Chloroflexota bacterium]
MTPIPLVFDHLLGLPAHPLLVHGAVVLVPMGAVAFVAAGLKESWRRAYYLPATAIVVVGGLFAFLAKESGESLSQSIRSAGQTVGEHPEQGDTAFLFAMILAIMCAFVYAVYRFSPQLEARFSNVTLPRLPVSYNTVLYAAVVPVAVLAVATMIIAGHSGAELVWKTNVK